MVSKTKYTYIKRYKKTAGKRCQHCTFPAKITAIRVRNGKKMKVAYCLTHAGEAGMEG